MLIGAQRNREHNYVSNIHHDYSAPSMRFSHIPTNLYKYIMKFRSITLVLVVSLSIQSIPQIECSNIFPITHSHWTENPISTWRYFSHTNNGNIKPYIKNWPISTSILQYAESRDQIQEDRTDSGFLKTSFTNHMKKVKKPRKKQEPTAAVVVNKSCPTVDCMKRFNDCVSCLTGISLKRCRQFTTLTYAALQSSDNKFGTAANNLKREQKALAKLFRKAKPSNNSTYCAGFIETYTGGVDLKIKNSAQVNSVGIGLILQDELLARFNINTEIDSSVIYDDKTVQRTSAAYASSQDGDDQNNWKLERRLGGSLRLPVQAKVVLFANGALRIWKIRQILRTLPKRKNWSSVFSSNPAKFRIKVQNGKTFLVFINFAKNFRPEYR